MDNTLLIDELQRVVKHYKRTLKKFGDRFIPKDLHVDNNGATLSDIFCKRRQLTGKRAVLIKLTLLNYKKYLKKHPGIIFEFTPELLPLWYEEETAQPGGTKKEESAASDGTKKEESAASDGINKEESDTEKDSVEMLLPRYFRDKSPATIVGSFLKKFEAFAIDFFQETKRHRSLSAKYIKEIFKGNQEILEYIRALKAERYQNSKH